MRCTLKQIADQRTLLAGLVACGLVAVTARAAPLAYVSNEWADQVTVIDVAMGGSVAVGEEPEGVAVSPDGELIYVMSESTHTVAVVQADTLKATVPAAKGAWGVAVGP